MINKTKVNAYCKKDISLIENYDKAVNDKTQTWHCHHRKETDENLSPNELKKLDLYYDRPANELIFLTESEHRSLHMSLVMKDKPKSIEHKRKLSELHKDRSLSEEHRKKISESMKGKTISKEIRNKISEAKKGKHRSEETKKKLSEKLKGKPSLIKGKHRVYDDKEHTKYHYE